MSHPWSLCIQPLGYVLLKDFGVSPEGPVPLTSALYLTSLLVHS